LFHFRDKKGWPATVTMDGRPIETRMRSTEWCYFYLPRVISNPEVKITILFNVK